MKSIFPIKFILILFCLIAFLFNTYAQDNMGKPEPLNNETMNMLLGTWKSEPYEFMQANWTETATHTMKLNGQCMYVELSSVSDKAQAKDAIIYITIDKDGTWKGWGCNEWGYTSFMTGNANGNKISEITKSDVWGEELREIVIDGNTMTHTISWHIHKDGKEIPMQRVVVYHKQ